MSVATAVVSLIKVLSILKGVKLGYDDPGRLHSCIGINQLKQENMKKKDIEIGPECEEDRTFRGGQCPVCGDEVGPECADGNCAPSQRPSGQCPVVIGLIHPNMCNQCLGFGDETVCTADVSDDYVPGRDDPHDDLNTYITIPTEN